MKIEKGKLISEEAKTEYKDGKIYANGKCLGEASKEFKEEMDKIEKFRKALEKEAKEEKGHRVMVKDRLMVLVPLDNLGSCYLLTYPNGRERKFLGYEMNEIISKHNARISRKALYSHANGSDDKSNVQTDNRSVCPLKSTKKGKNVLDEGERKYLEAVLAPFKNRVAHIEKEYSTRIVWCKPNSERISVKIGTGDFILLPWFDKGTMYKGMVANCEYTAEELGLWK